MHEAPIWGRKGWLKELKMDAAYDVDDLLPAMRNGLSVDNKLYAAPFHGESSMLMYRKDLTDKAGIQFAERPTWNDVKAAAEKIHDPSKRPFLPIVDANRWGRKIQASPAASARMPALQSARVSASPSWSTTSPVRRCWATSSQPRPAWCAPWHTVLRRHWRAGTSTTSTSFT